MLMQNMLAKTNERTDKRESWYGLGEMGKRLGFREMGNMWQILKDKGIISV
jgi:hypothetical protein